MGNPRPGPAPRRHQFTAEERRRGGQAAFRRAMIDAPWLLDWLQRKIDRTARPETLEAYRKRRQCG